MRIFGIDFSSAPEGNPLAVATCRLSDKQLRVEGIERWDTYAPLVALLNQPGPWVGAFDFPFSQPVGFLKRVDWPKTWRRYVTGSLSAYDRRGFRSFMEAEQAAQPEGQKHLKRRVDELAQSCSPMMLYYTPVGMMFFAGAPLLVAGKCRVMPFDRKQANPGGRKGVVVEGYPKLVAERWARRYKGGKDRKKAQDGRRAILKGITDTGGVMQSAYGFTVQISDALQRRCLDDAGADELDAVLCAIQAAWAHGSEKMGMAGMTDAVLDEGWIFDPAILERFKAREKQA